MLTHPLATPGALCAGSTDLLDALEDTSADHLWQWELRDAKHLPKEHRFAAHQIRCGMRWRPCPCRTLG